MVAALLKELELQKDFLDGKNIETIYLGGGTPSILSVEELAIIFEKIYALHFVENDAEITLEANPDDLTKEKLNALKSTPINRLSIGIQSFFDDDLKFMNRAHDANEALSCIENAKVAGFENLTIDLIYGTQTMSNEQWISNIQRAMDFQIQHLSCYCLTVEPKTALHHFVKTKKVPSVDEEQASRQFEMLIEKASKNDYIHYEISNFALEGWFSRHNSSYWTGKPYLGIGPSAHSFDGQNRQWNIAHNQKYLRALQKGSIPFEKEILTTTQRYNEYVMTSLRTIWGSNLEKVKQFGKNYENHFLKKINPFIDEESVLKNGKIYILSTKGKLLADRIAMELFFDE